ncbi:MAG: hypothetical protein LBR64_10145 [Dysgonamonadaceae bacterium]|nr:hypothetical protein [Dysgonamonadaceae bacterium]
MTLFKLKKFSEHRCYYRSLLLYGICSFFDRKSFYRINIMMYLGGRTCGHAWLTRNGKTFIRPNRNVLPFELEKIGENSRFVYWINA